MVTANVARGVGITLAAVGGMFLGFYVQDDMMRKSEVRSFREVLWLALRRPRTDPDGFGCYCTYALQKRVEDRVRAQVDRVVADREAKLKAAGR